jgi:hypothetical protein
MIMNGIVGFTMMLTILFCLGDVESVLGTDTGYPFIQIFYSELPYFLHLACTSLHKELSNSIPAYYHPSPPAIILTFY